MTSKFAKSLRRAVSVLKCFNTDELELSGTEISRKTGMHKTTAHRILATFAEDGLLDRNAKTGKYTIGTELYLLGNLYSNATDVSKAAKPVVRTLNELTGEAVNVSILNEGNRTLVLRTESKHAFRVTTHIGATMPAYSSAMGKAMLSELTEAELDKLYPEERLRPVTKKTIATKKELKLELEQIRKAGVAFDREGSYEGIVGIASVIRNASGKAIAAMGIAVAIFRMDQHNGERLPTLIRLGTSLASYRLGYQDMDNRIHRYYNQ